MGSGDEQSTSYVMKCRLGLDGYWQQVSERFCEMVGYAEEELKELKFSDITHPDDLSESLELGKKIREETLQEFETEKRYIKKSGEPVWVYVSGVLIKDDEGNPRYVICYIHDISESKRAQKKLKESEQRYRSLFQHNPNPVYYFDLEGNFQEMNDKLVEFSGYSRDELTGMNFESFIAKEDLEETKKNFEKAATGTPNEYEITVIVRGGQRKNVRVTKFPMYVEDEVVGVYGILEDVTDLKKNEIELRKEVEFNQTLLETTTDGYMLLSMDTNAILDVNPAYCRMVGYTHEELMDMKIEDVDVEIRGSQLKKKTDQVVEEGAGRFETKHRARDGSVVSVEVSLTVLSRGSENLAVAFLRDITKRKQAERNLEESKQRFKSLFEHNPNAVYSLDLEGNFLMGNKAMQELTGYTIEELREVDFEKLAAPDELKRLWEKFEAVASGKPQTFETAAIHKEGHRYEVQVTNLPIYINGNIEGLFGIARDITEEKRARRRLKESEERWQQLVMNNPQPVQITQNGNIIFINQAGAELYGASEPEEIFGKSVTDFSHPDAVEEVRKRRQKLEDQQYLAPTEHTIRRLDGSERYIQVHSIPVKYRGEAAIQTVIHDLTEREKQEKVVRGSLKEKEMLLKEIHHRVKNNLAVISGLLELQAMNTEDESTLSTLRDSQLRIQSIAMVHEKLYQSEDFTDIGFDVYLQELVGAISSTYGSKTKRVKIIYDLDPISLGLDQVIPCSLIVNEVIVNCYKHAFDEVPEGKIKIISEFNDPEVAIKIKDNGKGITEDFDITEQQSLGMTLVQTLAQQLEGKIDFSSESPDRGTVFELSFDKV